MLNVFTDMNKGAIHGKQADTATLFMNCCSDGGARAHFRTRWLKRTSFKIG